MNNQAFFDTKTSLKLFGLNKDLKFLNSLYLKDKLPNVLMFTGNKGVGKSTLINHFLFSVFDEHNYNFKDQSLSTPSNFYNQFTKELNPNIIYLKGSNMNTNKIEDIRNLKKQIYQSNIIGKNRFIIFDDIELFNLNSLNALLKIIEEPSKNNYFLLINNKSKPLIETISSRALEIKILIDESQRLKIIENLIKIFELELVLKPKESQLSPGNFVKFNYLCKENKISPSEDFVKNLSILLNLYKKNKDILFINLTFFIADFYFKSLKKNKILENDKFFEMKNYVFDNLNKFMLYNINQSALLNAISTKLK